MEDLRGLLTLSAGVAVKLVDIVSAVVDADCLESLLFFHDEHNCVVDDIPDLDYKPYIRPRIEC